MQKIERDKIKININGSANIPLKHMGGTGTLYQELQHSCSLQCAVPLSLQRTSRVDLNSLSISLCDLDRV